MLVKKPLDEKYKGKVGAYWDQRHTPGKGRAMWCWWHSPLVLAHLGRLVTGIPCASLAQLTISALQQRFSDLLPFERGLSVGCGGGQKEIELIQAGIVRRFTMYDLSAASVALAQGNAREAGCGDAVDCVQADAFVAERRHFDLVYWDNALHHMPNVHTALNWSRARLKPDGVLAMNDFVGASRFQWSDRLMKACNEILLAFDLPPVERPGLDLMLRTDPSEAADSGRIHEALLRFFPDALWTPLGGVIYHVALNGQPCALPDNLLTRMLQLDAKLSDAGEYVYAFATARKGK